jgi:hypothetical protein
MGSRFARMRGWVWFSGAATDLAFCSSGEPPDRCDRLRKMMGISLYTWSLWEWFFLASWTAFRAVRTASWTTFRAVRTTTS